MPSTRTTTLLLAVAALASQVSAHCSLLGIHGANGIVGLGYGVNRYGKFPRSPGEAGDAGSDVTMFQPGVDMPDPACGESPELGPLDPDSWLSQSEGFGIPSAFPNGSVVITAFMVNSDGAGDMKCDYNEDAGLKSWSPLTMNQNMPGKGGVLQGFDRTNHTVVVTFPENARCGGGIGKNTCVARCRTGRQTSTGLRYRFGGCFAVRLNATEGQTQPASSSSNTSQLPAEDSSSTDPAPSSSPSGSSSAGTTRDTGSTKMVSPVVSPVSGGASTGSTGATQAIALTKAQMKTIINAVVKKMRQQGMVYRGSASRRNSMRGHGQMADRSHA